MSYVKKADLVEELQRLGETAPASWTKLMIETRLEEVYQSRGLVRPQKSNKTEFRKMAILLNKASKKKDMLQQFMTKDLGMSISYNETIPQLQKAALKKILMMTEPEGQDPVGFGEFSSLSYNDLAIQQTQYCQWVCRTAKEGQCDYRLARLAKWLEQLDNQELTNHINKKSPTTLVHKDVKKTQGYVPQDAQKPVPASSVSEAASSKSATSSQLAETNQMLMQLMSMMGTLKEEVDVLKEDRPRKKADNKHVEKEGSESTLGSFSMVQPQ